VFLTGKRNHRFLPERARRRRDHRRAALDSLVAAPRAAAQADQPVQQPGGPPQADGHARRVHPAARRRQGRHLSGRGAGQRRSAGRRLHGDAARYS